MKEDKLKEEESKLIDFEYGDSNVLANTDHESQGQPRMKPYDYPGTL
ncbi:hypothetical protein [Hazenella coriacea]|nr:hypothetical protein [Hazenella coriacea]